jgi:hypothetical protein
MGTSHKVPPYDLPNSDDEKDKKNQDVVDRVLRL